LQILFANTFHGGEGIDDLKHAAFDGLMIPAGASFGDFDGLGLESTFALQELERRRIHSHRSTDLAWRGGEGSRRPLWSQFDWDAPGGTARKRRSP